MGKEMIFNVTYVTNSNLNWGNAKRHQKLNYLTTLFYQCYLYSTIYSSIDRYIWVYIGLKERVYTLYIIYRTLFAVTYLKTVLSYMKSFRKLRYFEGVTLTVTEPLYFWHLGGPRKVEILKRAKNLEWRLQ